MGIIADYKAKRRLAMMSAGAGYGGGSGVAPAHHDGGDDMTDEKHIQKTPDHCDDPCPDDYDEYCRGSFGGHIRIHCRSERVCWKYETLHIDCIQAQGVGTVSATISNWLAAHPGGEVVQFVTLGILGYFLIMRYPA